MPVHWQTIYLFKWTTIGFFCLESCMCVCVWCDSAVPSGYLYLCVMSRLSSEPTALVLMHFPTDLVDPWITFISPFDKRTTLITFALICLHSINRVTWNNTDYKDIATTEMATAERFILIYTSLSVHTLSLKIRHGSEHKMHQSLFGGLAMMWFC